MSRRRLALAVTLGALLYTGAVVLVAIADLENARLAIVIAVLAGLSFTIAGAFAAATRPENRTGAQMLAVGLLWSLGALQVTNGSLPFTIGYLLSGVAFVAFLLLLQQVIEGDVLTDEGEFLPAAAGALRGGRGEEEFAFRVREDDRSLVAAFADDVDLPGEGPLLVDHGGANPGMLRHERRGARDLRRAEILRHVTVVGESPTFVKRDL